MTYIDQDSFISELLAKEAAVREVGSKTGIDVSALIAEVKRQIQQYLTGGNSVKGDGVMKSGQED